MREFINNHFKAFVLGLFIGGIIGMLATISAMHLIIKSDCLIYMP